MSDNTDSIIQVQEQFTSLAIGRHPDQVISEAREAANAIKQIIDQKKKKVTFNGVTYIENEDWITLARFYGVTGRIKTTNYVEFGDAKGFESTAEAFLVATGQVIGTADAMCLNDEDNWGVRSVYEWVDGKRTVVGKKAVPLFQLRSMSQTRASSKVLSLLFKWVVVLAGLPPTPAEEMDETTVASGLSQDTQERKRPQRQTDAASKTAVERPPGNPDCISEAQGKMLYAVSKQSKLSDEEIKSKLRDEFKVEHSRDLPKKRFQEYLDSVDPEFKFHFKPKN